MKNVDLYNPTYGNFSTDVLGRIRLETYGTDIGQNSWLTVDELRRFIGMLGINKRSNVLEIATGSGGPALFLARETGCRLTGIDVNEKGVDNATSMAAGRGLEGIRFIAADAGKRLPFQDAEFDNIICIDAINHLPGRDRVLAEWNRVLKPGGRMLYTDPVVVTGAISNEEIAIRSSIGFFLFVPPGANEEFIRQGGFALIETQDVSGNEAEVSQRWNHARQAHRDDLLRIEDEQTFEGLQRFLAVVHRLSSERRLSRFAYLAEKRK